MIPIITGDPKDGPASYTRFVLPFAYCLEACQDCSPFRVYSPAQEPSYWRRHYFTVETADILYKRAKFFAMHREKQTFQIVRDGRQMTVCMSAPNVVLFEWPSAINQPVQHTSQDPLHLGFLIVEAFFPNQQPPVSLDDFLEFNEKFRYWQPLYQGHDEKYRAFLGDCPMGLHPPKRQVRDGDLTDIYFERWAALLKWPVEDDKGNLWSLFPRAWGQNAKAWIRGDQKSQDTGWITYADARTFVWTCAILQDGSHTLKAHLPCDLKTSESASWLSGYWIKLLNIDSPGESTAQTSQSTAFERKWVEPRTYTRWEHLGTLYGYNYHSGALLTLQRHLIFSHTLSSICPVYGDHAALDQDGKKPSRMVTEDKRRT